MKAFHFDEAPTGAFLALGEELQSAAPAGSIPPFRRELEAQLSPAFGFYTRPGNDHRRFLALSGRRVLARCLASVNQDLREREGALVGAIGLFEATEDYAAAEAVLGEAVRWLREGHGVARVLGPMNFDIWHGYRFLTRGFERDRFYGEPCNPPFYPEHFERFGFAARKRWNTFELDARALAHLAERGKSRRQDLLARGYRFEPFARRSFEAQLQALHSCLTRSFGGFLGFTPIGLSEFRELMVMGRHALHPDCSTFIHDEEGVLAGFAGVFVDLGEAVRAMRGSLGPFARLRFWRQRRGARRLLLHLGGITPEEAAKRSGVALGAFSHVIEGLRAQGCEQALGTLVARGNPVRRLYAEYAADDRREYTLYEKGL